MLKAMGLSRNTSGELITKFGKDQINSVNGKIETWQIRSILQVIKLVLYENVIFEVDNEKSNRN